jgi:hypothetical protein
MTGRRALWARTACDPELPAALRELIALGDSVSRSQRRRRERDLARNPGRVIVPRDLDEDLRLLLARAQNAVTQILDSDVRASGLFEADEPVLRRHEWEIACAIGRLAEVRDLPRADRGVGALTASVVDAQQRALDIALAGILSRITGLEQYAGQVTAADDARRDWQSALELSGLNDNYLDLVASTAADELAVAELGQLTDRAAITAQALRESLRQATVAAEVIALPPRAS